MGATRRLILVAGLVGATGAVLLIVAVLALLVDRISAPWAITIGVAMALLFVAAGAAVLASMRLLRGSAGRLVRPRLLIVAVGDDVDAKSLVAFTESRDRDRTIILTDRADIEEVVSVPVVVLSGLPTDGPGRMRTVTSRTLEVAAHHRVTEVQIWDQVTSAEIAKIAALDRRIRVPALRAIESLIDRRVRQRLDRHERDLERRLDRQDAHVRRTVVRASDDLYWQVEALVALYRLLDPVAELPRLRGWAVSPDLALHVVRLVDGAGLRTVVETGSGSSTVLIALAMERRGAGHVTAIDHDADYAAATRRLLEQRSLAHRATVLVAPLTEVVIDGESFAWYDLDPEALPQEIDLLLVDGPPEASGPQSRYPALPLLRSRLADRAHVVIDDARRDDEAEIARRWAALPGVERQPSLDVERAAVEFLVDRVSLEGP